MSSLLNSEQIADVLQLRQTAAEGGTEIVIIGAVALACALGDIGRYTNDVDLVVALDLGEFHIWSAKLKAKGWTRQPKREHRWRSPGGSAVDLLPAGTELRASGQIIWPESGMTMSLACFDHVFEHAISFEFEPGIMLPVAPAHVVALLKMVAWLDDAHRRSKDLTDLQVLLRRYQKDTDRIFCDEVFDARLADHSYVPAFLLGLDVAAIAQSADSAVVQRFLDKVLLADELVPPTPDDDFRDRADFDFQWQLRAFRQSFMMRASAPGSTTRRRTAGKT